MQLIHHTNFEALRLYDFVQDYTVLKDWKFMEENWEGEAWSFSQWLRPNSTPNKTQSISLDLNGLNSEIVWKVFERLGLELEKGMTEEDCIADFGTVFTREKHQEDRTTLNYIIGSDTTEYYLSLTITDLDGLVYLVIMNHNNTIQKYKQYSSLSS